MYRCAYHRNVNAHVFCMYIQRMQLNEHYNIRASTNATSIQHADKHKFCRVHEHWWVSLSIVHQTHTLRYAHVRTNAILFSCIPSHAGSTQSYTFPVCLPANSLPVCKRVSACRREHMCDLAAVNRVFIVAQTRRDEYMRTHIVPRFNRSGSWSGVGLCTSARGTRDELHRYRLFDSCYK